MKTTILQSGAWVILCLACLLRDAPPVYAEPVAGVPVPGSWGGHEALQDCIACHGERPEETSTTTPLLVDTVPGLCARCHGGLTTPVGWAHGPLASGECLLCHTAHQSLYPSLLAQPLPVLCTQCHANETLHLVAHHAEPSYQTCLDCHQGHASPRRALLKEVFLQTAAGLDYLNAHVEVMPRPVWAEEGASLGGLRGVVVIPEIKQIDLLKDYGITDTVVRTLVEQQLREQGIGFVAPSEKQAEQPGLVITLRLMALPSQRLSPVMDILCGSIRVSLRQPVRLLPHAVQGESPLCSATTWQTEGIVRWTTSQARVGLEQALTVLVREFCQDYRKANAATVAEISSPEKP